jgi:ubiquinone/menaquinone biosynthesis C-methylase UbiE
VDAILASFNPKTIAAIDRSDGFIAEARHKIDDARVHFEVSDATSLPWPSRSFDVTVSGLVLNFVCDGLRNGARYETRRQGCGVRVGL